MGMAGGNLEEAQNQYKRQYDRKTKARSFEAGDEVLVLLPATHNKLLMQWKGPLTVEARWGNVYQLRMGNKLKTFHANLLKKYIRRASQTDDQQPAITSDASHMDSPAEHANESAAAAVTEWEENHSEDAIFEDLLEGLDRKDASSLSQIQVGQQLSRLQHSELRGLTEQYQDIFSGIPGKTDLITHHIRTSDEIPIRAKPYPVPYNLRDALQVEVQEMLNTGIIRESRSPYASPVVVVKKKDEDLLHKLGGAKYFSKIDLSKGYWQIPVAEEDTHKTAFVTQDGQYEFLRMPFGMANAGATLV
ncbi:hypothetical protein C7M84_006939 [Penaeus vannamei]|uniref:Reverse transcriptase domain-containing protein n=1 Tax=Penaeus vannamei TaxID=6689 RepID=A0A423TDJ9_PENVA|nr:hypothetical protein C7M84_006939 [Penaeus vannamei]